MRGVKKSIQQEDNDPNSLHVRSYSLETIIALQRLLAEGIPKEADSEPPEHSRRRDIAQTPSDSPILLRFLR
jgi:hypothetical protein